MLTPEHRRYLLDNAIDPALAEAHGVESVEGGILFPYRNPGGRTVPVFRPDEPEDGPKYRSPKGEYPGLNVILEDDLDDTVLLVEGTKQALAAASCTPSGYTIAGMNGCWGFRHRNGDGDSHTIPDLAMVKDKFVVVAFDADYNTNPDVEAAGKILAREALALGAKSVRRIETGGEGSEGLDDLLARVSRGWRTRQLSTWIDEAQELRASGTTKPTPSGSPYVNIPALLAEEEPDDPWLFEPILARGRGHAIYAQRENQKSLFAFWMCIDLIRSRDDLHVMYLDYEMSRADLRDRFSAMGFTPESPELPLINERLHYWLHPDIPLLDTVDGGVEFNKEMEKLLDPEQELVVVIDTTIRAVGGSENDSDTIGQFSRFTASFLNKHENITWVRIDHAGKDKSQGQRGSSAKGDDVAFIWHITKTGEGVTIKNEKDRPGYVEQNPVEFKRSPEGEPLTFHRVGKGTSSRTMELVHLLDTADGLADDASFNDVYRHMREQYPGKARRSMWLEAWKYRQEK